jgi:hypothetical protein
MTTPERGERLTPSNPRHRDEEESLDVISRLSRRFRFRFLVRGSKF